MPRVGDQTPTYTYCAEYTRTQGNVAVALSTSYALRPHPWQRTVLDDWLALDDNGKLLNSLCLLLVSRQQGKALALDTEIPTPDGWRRMADIHVGDYVFGQDGKPSRVTLESEIFHKPMYRVRFRDGATVDASADHVWTVRTQTSRQSCRYVPRVRAKRQTKYHGDGWFEATTEEMAANFLIERRDDRQEYRYRVPMNKAVEYPWQELPVHPYVLGAWLGDGTSKNATITIAESDAREMERLFSECGETLTRQRTKDRAPCFRIGSATKGRSDSGSFYMRLKSLGVLRNKHVPDSYMTASVEQRWALLQGLMDTDGTCSKAGECEFTQKSEVLARQLQELCASLGIRAHIHSKHAKCNGVDAGIVWRVQFYTDRSHPCFRMRRKKTRLKDHLSQRMREKAIVSIEAIPDAPSKCIAIDNESHLYLAGRLYTPTHNTGACEPRETVGLIVRGERILHTAQEFQTSQVAFDRLREKFGDCRNDPNAKYPELNRLVKKYTVSQGQMVLDLTNGGHIEFRTRGKSGNAGRGGTFDLVVIDEAQIYTDQQDAALSPLNSAAPLGSPQTILMGTVPSPEKPYEGEVFTRLLDMAHSDPYQGMCIHEWSADEVGDVTDVDRWYRYNPSLGYQLLLSALQKDARAMTPEKFAQEHLSWRGAAKLAAHPIDAKAWDECATDEAPDGRLVYAVKFAPDGLRAVIAVCVIPYDDGPLHVEVADVCALMRGLDGVVSYIADVIDFAECVVVDGKSNAQTFVGKLLDVGVPEEKVMQPNTAQAIGHYTALVDAVRSRSLTHNGDEALTEAAKGCAKRAIGSKGTGGYGFESQGNADASLVESVAHAHGVGVRLRRSQDEDEMEVWF